MLPEELSDRLWAFAARIGKVVDGQIRFDRQGQQPAFTQGPHLPITNSQ
jgi:hypothetical protein